MNGKELLKYGFDLFHLPYEEEKIEQLLDYQKAILEKNKVMNLTAITDDRDFIIKHFLDSLSVLAFFELKEGAKIIDIGTGAGFPSLPIKIIRPDLEFCLLDSLQKRILFLEETIEFLGLKNVSCIHTRAEQVAENEYYIGEFDYAFARAVASLEVLYLWTIPFLKIEGEGIYWKGKTIDEELKKGHNNLLQLNASLIEVKEIQLPTSEIEHTLIRIKKLGHTPTKSWKKLIKQHKKVGNKHK